ncbi:amino acid adenylation domain-containing protein [Streptomyces umbrinus]|uniref:Amino acid adenylation domain-containing protein n=1 Tax=Streptomyces umbrinus TaxID=67370 RepID=A0ABU0STP6_9ACTN|nr:non-ribosomal peptide synthetase [Streptomyces umbrinus]MDQ1026940.1 amino acid adenylation domain-containing protein [Streptomyces umbrinus]
MNAELLSERFAEQAFRTPHAAAVIDGTRAVSYEELDRASLRMARHLRDLGAGPDTLVGVSLPRGVDLVVALLGVWRAGAGYVPLDPVQPPARLSGLVREAGARLVLAGPALEGAVRDAGARRVGPEEVHSSPDEPAELPVADPANVAYAVFTSGSTGRPKAVAVTHAGIAHRVGWTVRLHGLGAGDRILQKTTIGFDAAVWEIFAPLVSGAAVVLAPAGAERDPAALLRAVADHDVTVLQVVPSVLRLLVEEGDWSGCGSLRLLFSAGEALHAELVTRLRERAGTGLEIWNTYGPTECSIDATAQLVDSALTTGPVPIGRPLPGMRVLVLDPNGLPVPVGVPGELYAGGVGVARGYAGRPDLTAESFVPDPYATEPGDRLYRTGDQVRWRADHTLEYLGRLDHQVKVNGVRIEPAEVEAALAAHPAVTGAVVTPYAADDGGKRLAAHLIVSGDLDTGELRGFLAERLPDSHVPAFFHVVDAFPLLANGKVDRTMLPAPDEIVAAEQPAFTAPRDAAEELVAGVWAELLGLDRVGAFDDFFALGGTSLQLTRLAARLRAASGEKVSLRGLFAATTVAAQAELVGATAGAAGAAASDTRGTGVPVAGNDAATEGTAEGTAQRAVDGPVAGGSGGRAQAVDDGPDILPVPRDADLPLSSGQRRLWFLDRMHPGSPEWVAPLFLRLPAALDDEAVRTALAALAARYEPLRTRYVDRGGEPLQVIDDPGAAGVELRVEDATRDGVPALFGEQFARGFDLAAGPLWRALLVRVPGEDHLLLLTMHHITCDGWSTVLLERELRELCAARLEEREPRLPDLSLQYADYGAWQHARLTDDVIERELAHWRAALDGIVPLDLPVDRPRPAVRDPRGAVVPFRISPELAAQLVELGRAQGATPFMTLLTAYATLVARYSGQWDVPVGTPVAGRTRPETENMVGFFLNSLVVRCGLGADLSFTEALGRVRDAARAAFVHQELPFEHLVDELQPERDLSRTPLYQVAFDLHSEGVTSVVTQDADLAAFTEAWQVAKTDLSLFMRQTPDGSLDGVVEYATSLFDRSTAEQLTGHFLTLLEQVATHPDTPLGAIALLDDDERRLLLTGWNDTAYETDEKAVFELFEEQARSAPGRTALTFGAQTVTYGELDAAANRLAHHLRTRCVGAESRVAVLLDRGPELVTALLAVWKAGGAYVPVDPSYPAERIAAMCRAADARTVVTASVYANRFASSGARLLLVDADADEIAARPAAAPARTRDLDRLAYTIFTSGSTGTPKGVEVTHRGLAGHVAWAARELAGQDYGGAALFSSVAFDLVVPNLWTPLVTGQRLFLLPQDTDMSELGKRLAEAEPFSFIKLTPSHLDILALQLTPAQAGALAPVMVVAGEAFTRSTLERWRELAPDMRLINEYGPTEASVGTSVYPVPQEGAVGIPDVLPIGRPLPNMTMYVLDAALEPVPAGVTGELYVGGAGVARGYAGRPELTAERFVPDPYGSTPGARLYRTGDLTRRLADGNIAFLGRIDDQVKIRGHRVELGEIRTVLAGHPDVRDACVVTVDGELAAYCTPADIAADVLREHLAASLPDYMIPATFTALDALPVNANGKVDRKALPAPGQAADGEEHTAPSGPVEERVAEIWSELLGVQAGRHDNFFHIGGNSILAIRLISCIQREFEIDFAVRTVFEGPTIARLAATVEERVTAQIAVLSDAELLRDADLADPTHAADSAHTTDLANNPSPTKEHQA